MPEQIGPYLWRPEIPFKDKWCPLLHEAIKVKNFPKVQEVMKENFDLRKQIDGRNAIELAVTIPNNMQIIKHLLHNTSTPELNSIESPHGSVLQQAARLGEPDVVSLLLTKQAEINPPLEKAKQQQPLQLAVMSGSLETVELLLKHGADVNFFRPGLINGAVQAAVYCGNPRMVKLLLERGADLAAELPGEYGFALDIALSEGDEGMIGMLVKAGAQRSPLREGKKKG